MTTVATPDISTAIGAKRYRPSLDGLRAAAILTVFACHAAPTMVPGGSVGVAAFFALSGYLITALVLAEIEDRGRLDVVKFYGRRALRLFPALYLLLLVVIAYESWTGSLSSWGIASVALYFGNWVRAFGGDLGVLGATWSLAVEEQFYLLWPLVVVVALKFTRDRWPAPVVLGCLSLAGCILAPLLRVLLWDPTSVVRIYNGTDTRMDSILYGTLLACLLRCARLDVVKRVAGICIVPSLLFLAVMVLAEPQVGSSPHWVNFMYQTLGYSVMAFSSAVLVAHLVLQSSGIVARLLSVGPFVWLGKISYGFYLWHLFVLAVLERTALPKVISLLLSLVVTVAIATVSFYGLEKPLQKRFRKQFTVD